MPVSAPTKVKRSKKAEQRAEMTQHLVSELAGRADLIDQCLPDYPPYGKRILLDTGNNAEILAHNAKARGIDLTKLDFVVVTHRHGDHTSGLNYLMSVNPKVKIYAPKENFGVFGAMGGEPQALADGGQLWMQNAGFVWVPFILAATVLSWLGMNDIADAKAKKRKVICFVTGVPGAGQTLVGLAIATKHIDPSESLYSVFLSGNGPLVKILHEALARDAVTRAKQEGGRMKKGEAQSKVKAFIQNVHHFRDEALLGDAAPADHVVIFDEAQRAWNQRKTADFMKQRKNRPDFPFSEPAFLISYLDRHTDWAVIVCLVGGGQEIHTGEAGIGEWLAAVNQHFPHWHLYLSSQLTDSEYAANTALDVVRERSNSHVEDDLHLAVSMRSFRAEHVSGFVKAVLDCDQRGARAALASLQGRFPIVLTRELPRAKQWIRTQARGNERFGLVASSKAMRLKPHAIDIRVAVDPVHWFLNDRDDTRSSYYLEDCATEFQVQGLELDWICVNWDGDLRFSDTGWSCHDFRGNRWTNINNVANQQYLRNAYRVLLTRARQGMVVFVPAGESTDPTRRPEYYDATFQYLADLGIPVLEDIQA